MFGLLFKSALTPIVKYVAHKNNLYLGTHRAVTTFKKSKCCNCSLLSPKHLFFSRGGTEDADRREEGARTEDRRRNEGFSVFKVLSPDRPEERLAPQGTILNHSYLACTH